MPAKGVIFTAPTARGPDETLKNNILALKYGRNDLKFFMLVNQLEFVCPPFLVSN